jgi:hypothetical protein
MAEKKKPNLDDLGFDKNAQEVLYALIERINELNREKKKKKQ